MMRKVRRSYCCSSSTLSTGKNYLLSIFNIYVSFLRIYHFSAI